MAHLIDLGVAADRLTAISKGKDQPLCHDKIESCWQRNRRGQFVGTAKMNTG